MFIMKAIQTLIAVFDVYKGENAVSSIFHFNFVLWK